MSFVPVRELRNHTSSVIERAQGGEEVTITSNGVPVATLVPVRPPQKEFLTVEELRAMRPTKPDLTLERDIREISSDTTDDLGPIQ